MGLGGGRGERPKGASPRGARTASQMTMVGSGYTKASTSGLSSGGTSFSNSWQHS
jgi:hypothetical protein